jgi:hypothetical protein
MAFPQIYLARPGPCTAHGLVATSSDRCRMASERVFAQAQRNAIKNWETDQRAN